MPKGFTEQDAALLDELGVEVAPKKVFHTQSAKGGSSRASRRSSGLLIYTAGLPTRPRAAIPSNDSTQCGWTALSSRRSAGRSSHRWIGKAC